MGFLKGDQPDVDIAQWRTGTRAEMIRPMTRFIAESGMGAPLVIHLLYVVKISLYFLGGWLFVLATSGIDGFTDFSTWWSEPIVFQKMVLYTMLIEVVGLGCSFGPLAGRYFPPMGSILYWLRPGTIRQPPWPDRVPLTKGHNRTALEIGLYAALLVLLLVALLSDGSGPIPSLGTDIGVLAPWHTVAVLAVLALVGLRDKTIFLAARGEVYGPLALVFLFTGPDIIVGAKVVFLLIWMGAATSKLNRHFPFVIASMMANSPIVHPRALKRKFFRRFPDDLRPSPLAGFVAHFSTAVEMLVPLVLFFSHGGWVTAIAAFVMVCFHLGILTAIPSGVPLEWNVFMITGLLWLFVTHADIGLSSVRHPVPIAAVFVVLVAVVTVGNLSPRRVSFLPGMRYYAGNWDTSLWCTTPSADDKIVRASKALGPMYHRQLAKLVGNDDDALVAIFIGHGFRSMNSHGRALYTLVHRALDGLDEDAYTICEGEMVCAVAIGWNFGDGHLHNESLVEALHARCAFEPGELRVVILDGQPIHRQRQAYRLVDGATGEFERGYIDVGDMVDNQPWNDDVPVHVLSTPRV
ncbi:DUF3556 domain-containing protein [Mycolicibacterium moriokaense]|nr:DUF3556 domain-containing protein [Mycolicibacterium moriokaense]